MATRACVTRNLEFSTLAEYSKVKSLRAQIHVNNQPGMIPMLNAIRQFFENNLLAAAKPGSGNSDEHALQLATAALLFEMMRMDEHVKEDERQVIFDELSRRFQLDKKETEELLQLAEEEARDATDYHQFTSLINQHFSPEQKLKVIELLWQVAFADGHLDSHEEHLVRKLSELLYVPHREFIAAKHRIIKNAQDAE